MSVPGLVAAGHYAEIAENVDLEYKIIGEQVKENLILKSIKAAALEYSFSLQFPGMMIVIREDGGIDLIDEETEEVFIILPRRVCTMQPEIIRNRYTMNWKPMRSSIAVF